MRRINSVAVIGAGTMGAGIAAASAAAGCRVLVLDSDEAAARRALDGVDADAQGLVEIGTVDDRLDDIAGYDWVCEAVIEDLATKRELFERLEAARSDGSVISSNTSGIPLRQISDGMSERFRRDVAITHFFNPVRVMKLFELVAGRRHRARGDRRLRPIRRRASGQGRGARQGHRQLHRQPHRLLLHAVGPAHGQAVPGRRHDPGDHRRRAGRSRRAAAYRPVRAHRPHWPRRHGAGWRQPWPRTCLPAIGGSISLRFLPRNRTWPTGASSAARPAGGFSRRTKLDDGSRKAETFDLVTGEWRPASAPDLEGVPADLGEVMFADSPQGELARHVFGGTLAYAADLVPEIADDIANVDNAIRWGFNWVHGPFEMLDHLGPARVIEFPARHRRPAAGHARHTRSIRPAHLLRPVSRRHPQPAHARRHGRPSRELTRQFLRGRGGRWRRSSGSPASSRQRRARAPRRCPHR